MLRIGDQVVKGNRAGRVIADERDDPYGYGTRIVQVQWATGRRAWMLARNVRKA